MTPKEKIIRHLRTKDINKGSTIQELRTIAFGDSLNADHNTDITLQRLKKEKRVLYNPHDKKWMIFKTAHEIIEELMQSAELVECINKADYSIREDLRSELALALLETDPDKIITIYNEKKIKFYAVRIILTMAFSKTSPFYKKYRLTHTEFKDLPAIDDSDIAINKKLTEERIIEGIGRLDWYENEMIKLYLEMGNYRDMQKATHIPFASCFRTVKDATERIKKNINMPITQKEFNKRIDRTIERIRQSDSIRLVEVHLIDEQVKMQINIGKDSVHELRSIGNNFKDECIKFYENKKL